MRFARFVWIFLAGIAVATECRGAERFSDRATLEMTLDKTAARPGETVSLTLTMNIKPQYHTYPLAQPFPEAGAFTSSLLRPKFGEFIFVGELTGPHGEVMMRDGAMVEWVTNSAEWKWQFVVHPEARPGKRMIKLRGTLPACNDNDCVNGSPPDMEFEVLAGARPVDSKYKAEVEGFPLTDPGLKTAASTGGPDRANLGPPVAVEGKTIEVVLPAATLEEHESNLRSVESQLEKFIKPTTRPTGGLWNFLTAAVFWGAVALITPCVFPMIPITVSFFLHQSEHEHHKPVRMALIYCGTIILVLGISALTLLKIFRALSIDPRMNIALGGLFVFFALSLFGLYEITLPSRLTAFTSSREGRGGTVGTIFMALTFTIVSFTCVAPFLGGFSGMAASGEFSNFELVLGAMVFSTTFAAPFFVLAIFPSLIKKLPQSGSWLNSVKVVMGFLELAAALKFFRTAELRLLPQTQYFTYDLVLGIWVALSFLVGLYLLNLFRLHHDEPIEHIGVLRMLMGLAFLALAIYFLPAIFKLGKGENQRPKGVIYAWVDSFLLPEPTEAEMPWSANLKGSIDASRKDLERTGKRQFIFLDCTGVTCTNCKYNERTIFSRPDVREPMLSYRLVQNYTDTVPDSFYPQGAGEDRRYDEAKANLAFQRETFGTEQLPLYVAMEVTRDKVIVRGIYDEAKINDAGRFLKFLQDVRQDEKK
jgi:thiol:disulfide interchange protein